MQIPRKGCQMEPIHTQTPSLRDQAQFIPCLCRSHTPHGAQAQAQNQAPPPPAPVAKEAREAVARGSHVTTRERGGKGEPLISARENRVSQSAPPSVPRGREEERTIDVALGQWSCGTPCASPNEECR